MISLAIKKQGAGFSVWIEQTGKEPTCPAYGLNREQVNWYVSAFSTACEKLGHILDVQACNEYYAEPEPIDPDYPGGWVRVRVESLKWDVCAWAAPRHLWGSVWIADGDKGKEVPTGCVLAQLTDDAPYRILRLVKP